MLAPASWLLIRKVSREEPQTRVPQRLTMSPIAQRLGQRARAHGRRWTILSLGWQA